jgi:hypothetical protein
MEGRGLSKDDNEEEEEQEQEDEKKRKDTKKREITSNAITSHNFLDGVCHKHREIIGAVCFPLTGKLFFHRPTQYD